MGKRVFNDDYKGTCLLIVPLKLSSTVLVPAHGASWHVACAHTIAFLTDHALVMAWASARVTFHRVVVTFNALRMEEVRLSGAATEDDNARLCFLLIIQRCSFELGPH